MFILQSSILFQILDFVFLKVTIFSFDHMTDANREYIVSRLLLFFNQKIRNGIWYFLRFFQNARCPFKFINISALSSKRLAKFHIFYKSVITTTHGYQIESFGTQAESNRISFSGVINISYLQCPFHPSPVDSSCFSIASLDQRVVCVEHSPAVMITLRTCSLG